MLGEQRINQMNTPGTRKELGEPFVLIRELTGTGFKEVLKTLNYAHSNRSSIRQEERNRLLSRAVAG